MNKALLVAILLLSPALGVLAQDAGTTSYYPLKEGSEWTYDAGNEKIVMRVKKFEDVEGLECAVLAAKNETDSEQKTTEHLAVKKDGIYRVKGNGLAIEPPLLVLKLPPKDGATWKIDSEMGGTKLTGTGKISNKAVTVPAGAYKTVVSTLTFEKDKQSFSMAYHFAPGVGMVLLEAKFGDTKVIPIKLKKYEPGEAK